MYRRRCASFTAGILLVLVALTAGELSAEWIHHEVERGDTLYSLANRYEIPLGLLEEVNELDDVEALPVGYELKLPGLIRVERGETWYGIAREFGITTAELLELNDKEEGAVLRSGEVIRVPLEGRAEAVVSQDSVSSRATDGNDLSGRADALRYLMEAEDSESASRPDVDDEGEKPEGHVGEADAPPEGETVSGATTEDTDDRLWPHPGERSAWGDKFPGISIEAGRGEKVRAVAPGRVTYVGPYASFGRVVIIESPEGYSYIYGGNEEVVVAIGDEIGEGTVVGTVGPTHARDETFVYFSVWRGNEPIDPERWPHG